MTNTKNFYALKRLESRGESQFTPDYGLFIVNPQSQPQPGWLLVIGSPTKSTGAVSAGMGCGGDLTTAADYFGRTSFDLWFPKIGENYNILFQPGEEFIWQYSVPDDSGRFSDTNCQFETLTLQETLDFLSGFKTAYEGGKKTLADEGQELVNLPSRELESLLERIKRY